MIRPPCLRPIYNYPTVPETSARHKNAATPPVTRRDLSADFRCQMQFYLNDWRTSSVYDAIHRLQLASSIMFQWYGCVEIREARKDPDKAGIPIPGWEEAARKHAARGTCVYFNSLATSRISRDCFEQMQSIFGHKFLGFNEGEWDGAYINQVSSGAIPLAPDRSREEACRHYLEWMRQAHAAHHHYMLTMSSCCLGCHYGAELGARMLAVELSQVLPSSTMLLAFCRGAGKQYDLLMHTIISCFSSRGAPGTGGFKCYPVHGQPQTVLPPEGYRLHGPEHGASLGLLKRLWWISYMSGSSITGFDASYFPCDPVSELAAQSAVEPQLKEPFHPRDVFAHLTPLGWMHWEVLQACRRHPLRGVPYIPFAVMLPFAHGWHPQGYYTKRRECVWGNIPYNEGDRRIDAFFRRVYPGYASAHFVPCLDERGIVTNTPFGDSFDVILSNASEDCLAKYQAAIVPAGLDAESDPALAARLGRFAKAGGVVMTEIADFENAAESYALIKIEGRPIYYLVNVTDQADELIVTLCNNSHAMPWEGRVRIKGQTIRDVEEWVAYGEADVCEGALRCGVPANDVRVYRLRTAQPFLNLLYRNVPWRQLGYGAPEISEQT